MSFLSTYHTNAGIVIVLIRYPVAAPIGPNDGTNAATNVTFSPAPAAVNAAGPFGRPTPRAIQYGIALKAAMSYVNTSTRKTLLLCVGNAPPSQYRSILFAKTMSGIETDTR